MNSSEERLFNVEIGSCVEEDLVEQKHARQNNLASSSLRGKVEAPEGRVTPLKSVGRRPMPCRHPATPREGSDGSSPEPNGELRDCMHASTGRLTADRLERWSNRRSSKVVLVVEREPRLKVPYSCRTKCLERIRKQSWGVAFSQLPGLT